MKFENWSPLYHLWYDGTPWQYWDLCTSIPAYKTLERRMRTGKTVYRHGELSRWLGFSTQKCSSSLCQKMPPRVQKEYSQMIGEKWFDTYKKRTASFCTLNPNAAGAAKKQTIDSFCWATVNGDLHGRLPAALIWISIPLTSTVRRNYHLLPK